MIFVASLRMSERDKEGEEKGPDLSTDANARGMAGGARQAKARRRSCCDVLFRVQASRPLLP
jgi:hypothetical protein